MEKIIVTTGQLFTDIDGLACAVAYTELLLIEGKVAQCILPGLLNKSVTKTIRGWDFEFDIRIKQRPTFSLSYVLVDISEKEFFSNFVSKKDIIEIFDHRHGFEDYWKEKLGINSHIEMVGSCATLVFEEFEKRKVLPSLSKSSANLLTTAIISNTLNFKASVTTDRDRKAYNKLKKYSDLPKNWIEIYFQEQDTSKLINIYDAIINDTKNINGTVIGQLEMWNSKELFNKHLNEIQRSMESFGKSDWFLTSPSISEETNYIFTTNENIKKLLEKAIGVKFDNNIGKTNKLWLRKEIAEKMREIL